MGATSIRFFVCVFFMFLHLSGVGQVTFVIDQIPRATPFSDTVYLTGSFNNWAVNDPEYALRKLPSGYYSITIPIDTGKIEYKFTRGSWMKIETDRKNEYLPNRTMKIAGPEIVSIKIQNWQDLGGAQGLPIVVFYFFSIAFQSILLIILTGRITKKDPVRFQLLIVFNSMLALLYSGEIWYSISNLSIHAILVLSGQFALFLWGPFVLLFLIFYTKQRVRPIFWLLMVPAFLVLTISILRMADYKPLDFLVQEVSVSLSLGNMLAIASAGIFNLSIFLYCGYRFGFRLFRFFDLEPEDRFLDVFIKVQVVVVAMIGLNLAILYMGNTSTFLNDFHLVPISFSLIVFVEMYYLWRFPGIIKERNRYVIEQDDADIIKEKLIEMMIQNQPFKDPDLSLQKLSDLLETKPHILSRVLNDHFRHNFRDFVNQYRVNEFIRMAGEEQKLQTFTYLALAMEVGFNSKSTFNLAFKKATGMSPREYFKN